MSAGSGLIVWVVALFVSIGVVAFLVLNPFRGDGTTSPGPSTSVSAYSNKRAERSKGLAPRSSFKGIGGREKRGARISSNIGAEMRGTLQDCMAEQQMGDEVVIQPPPGVQPGTLVSPPDTEKVTPPLFDAKYGFRQNTGKSIMTQEQMVAGPAGIAFGVGRTTELSSGEAISKFSSKQGAKDALTAVSKKFDLVFSQKLFPKAAVVQRKDGTLLIVQDEHSASGQCIYLENYYDYVEACIAHELGYAPKSTLNWAKGSGIKPGFDNIDSSLDALRVGLSVDSASAAGYHITANGRVKSLSTDELVGYTIKWPVDQTVLVEHYATFD